MSEVINGFDPAEMEMYGLDAEVETDRRIWAATEPSGETLTDYSQDILAFGSAVTRQAVERPIIVTRGLGH